MNNTLRERESERKRGERERERGTLVCRRRKRVSQGKDRHEDEHEGQYDFPSWGNHLVFAQFIPRVPRQAHNWAGFGAIRGAIGAPSVCSVFCLRSDFKIENQNVSVWAPNSALGVVMWQVQFPKGWQNIDQHAQHQISEAFLRGEASVVFSVLQSKRLNWWAHYCINFEKMEQTNIESSNVRAVKWTGAPLSLDDRLADWGAPPSLEDAPGLGAVGDESMAAGPLPLALADADTTTLADIDDASGGRTSQNTTSNPTSRRNKIRKISQTDNSASSAARQVLGQRG